MPIGNTLLLNFKFFKDKKISKRIKVSLGMTLKGGAKLWPPSEVKVEDEANGKMKFNNSNFLYFSAEKIFIHPLLGSAEVMY